MKKLMMLMLAACAAIAMTTTTGCRAVTVRNYGEEVVRDADDKPVTLPDGKIQTISKGWKVHHNQHWMATEVDTMSATVKPEEISFSMGKVNTKPSEELTKLVDVSLKGAAELAAKVGAAIATSGGSVAGDAAYSALKTAISNFISKGGDASKATVSCADGSCTITDGAVTEVCENCIAK